jgi:hypothetical protein
MAVAGELYTSGTFWSAMSVLVALIVGAATVAVTYLTRFARPRLIYGVGTKTPLLTAPDGVRDDLELRHRGRLLKTPHVIEVVLAGEGRRDIPRTAFDGGEPIRLDLGAPIVELLQVKAVDSASATPTPPVHVDGAALLVGPALIGRRQTITITALVEGEPTLHCDAPLPNARVRQALSIPPPLTRDAKVDRAVKMAIPLVFGIAAIVVLLLNAAGVTHIFER